MYLRASGADGFSVKRRTAEAISLLGPDLRADSSFDITISGLRPRGRNTEDDEGSGLGCELQRGADELPVASRLANKSIGGQHGHECIAAAFFVQQMRCGKPNGRGRVATHRLDQYVPRRDLGQFPAHGIGLFAIGNNPGAGSGKDRSQALEGLHEHGFLTDDVEQLLGRAHAASGPKTCTTPPGENDGVSGW